MRSPVSAQNQNLGNRSSQASLSLAFPHECSLTYPASHTARLTFTSNSIMSISWRHQHHLLSSKSRVETPPSPQTRASSNFFSKNFDSSNNSSPPARNFDHVWYIQNLDLVLWVSIPFLSPWLLTRRCIWVPAWCSTWMQFRLKLQTYIPYEQRTYESKRMVEGGTWGLGSAGVTWWKWGGNGMGYGCWPLVSEARSCWWSVGVMKREVGLDIEAATHQIKCSDLLQTFLALNLLPAIACA